MNGGFKISFCVVCMNRLHQLKQTLIQNILDNADYENLEFVVLNYNSKDGMEEWVMENLADHIKTGRVVYYKTIDPDSWSPSHSKNLAFKLATGDILCSIWADYYAGVGFAQYVNESFNADNNIVLTPIDFHETRKNYFPPGDVLGKVCVKRSDFLRIHGFDERMDKHGFEDYDFVNRLEMIGVRRVLIEDFDFLKFLKHDDSERFKLPTERLEGLFLSFVSPSRTDMLLLYKDRHFQKGNFVDNLTINSNDSSFAFKMQKKYPRYALMPKHWQCGTWVDDGNIIRFLGETDLEFYFNKGYENNHQVLISPDECVFYKINDKHKIDAALKFEHFYSTQHIMIENLENETPVVNYNEFGQGIVYKNFSLNIPISIC